MKKVLIGAILIIVLCLGMNYMNDNNYDQKEIDKIKSDISLLRSDLDSLKNKRQEQQLTYPIDDVSRNIIKDELKDKILQDILFDSLWNQFFYFKTIFEDVEHDTITCNAGFGASCPSSGVGPDGLSINTEQALTNHWADLEKTPAAPSGLSWGKEQRIRMGIQVPVITAQTIYLVRGSTNLAGTPYYGFKIVNATLYGVIYDGSTETLSGALKTIVANVSYLIEARYSPKDKIVFYVGEEEKGVINTGLIDPNNTSIKGFYNFNVLTSENIGKGIFLSFFEYIQRK